MANKNPANAGFFFIYHPRSNGLITPSPPLAYSSPSTLLSF